MKRSIALALATFLGLGLLSTSLSVAQDALAASPAGAAATAPIDAIPNQKRTITLLTATELKFDNPRTPNGMTLRTAWKRAAAP